jgi:hypothetical protein
MNTSSGATSNVTDDRKQYKKIAYNGICPSENLDVSSDISAVNRTLDVYEVK